MPAIAQVTRVLGSVGAIVVAVGYIPQIVHIAREGCSAGVSVRAWTLWLISSGLIMAHALAVADPVFIALQGVNIAAILAIIALAKRFERGTCKTHAAGPVR
jgi:uncharacterized protein with PQ loop repeat